MASIRIMIGAALVMAAFTFGLMPAQARSCMERDADGTCGQSSPATPFDLLEYTKQKRAAQPAQHKKEKPAVTNSIPEPASLAGEAESSVDSAADFAPASEPGAVASGIRETVGVAVTFADDWNEIDAQADVVKVVNPDELNEIDLAADMRPVAFSYETQVVASPAPAPAPVDETDAAWIGKLLAAVGGTLAVAAATARLLIA